MFLLHSRCGASTSFFDSAPRPLKRGVFEVNLLVNEPRHLGEPVQVPPRSSTGDVFYCSLKYRADQRLMPEGRVHGDIVCAYPELGTTRPGNIDPCGMPDMIGRLSCSLSKTYFDSEYSLLEV